MELTASVYKLTLFILSLIFFAASIIFGSALLSTITLVNSENIVNFIFMGLVCVVAFPIGVKLLKMFFVLEKITQSKEDDKKKVEETRLVKLKEEDIKKREKNPYYLKDLGISWLSLGVIFLGLFVGAIMLLLKIDGALTLLIFFGILSLPYVLVYELEGKRISEFEMKSLKYVRTFYNIIRWFLIITGSVIIFLSVINELKNMSDSKAIILLLIFIIILLLNKK